MSACKEFEEKSAFSLQKEKYCVIIKAYTDYTEESMYGIIVAMESERDTLLAHMKNVQTERVYDTDFYLGSLGEKAVVLAQSGVGKVNAAFGTLAMIERYKPTLILNTGVAGGLANGIRQGDVAIAQDLVQHDMDTSPLGDPVGYISGIGKVFLPCDEALVSAAKRAAEKLGYQAFYGTIASGDAFIGTSEARTRILTNFPTAVSCEMEGASCAHVAYRAGVPFAAVRTISDSANGDAPMDFGAFVLEAAKKNALLIEEIFAQI